MQSAARKRAIRGFASTEVVVAALILVILFVATTPFRRAAMEHTLRTRCRAARQLVALAQRQYALAHNGQYAQTFVSLRELLPAPPRCPCGGRFEFRRSITENDHDSEGRAIPGGTEVITCSTDRHWPVPVPR